MGTTEELDWCKNDEDNLLEETSETQPAIEDIIAEHNVVHEPTVK